MWTEPTPQAGALWQRLCLYSQSPTGQEETVAYLAEQLSWFLRPRERILICFPDHSADSFGGLMIRAARLREATVLCWGPDYRWKALLRQAFTSRATCIAGPPELLLGLSKLARATRTPLFIRNAVIGGRLCGYAVEGTLRRELDCRVWSFYCPWGTSAAGFAPDGQAMTLRQGLSAVILDGDRAAEEGREGKIALGTIDCPGVWYPTGDIAQAIYDTDGSVRLAGLRRGASSSRESGYLDGKLLRWSSILDYRAVQTESGLALELVTFPGEKLPTLPTCARRVVRPWNPDADMPFFLRPSSAAVEETPLQSNDRRIIMGTI